MRGTRLVVFDSSFLMAVVERPTTWYEDIVEGVGLFKPLLPECVKEELERLASGQGKRARTAGVALDLAKSFETVECGSAHVDDEIVSLALSTKAAVATADSELAGSVRRAHGVVITLRRGRVALG